MSEDKAALLRSLAIERDPPMAAKRGRGLRPLPILLAVGVGGATVAGGALLLRPEAAAWLTGSAVTPRSASVTPAPQPEPVGDPSSAIPVASGTPAPAAPATPPSQVAQAAPIPPRASGLVASGYVVARRQATVSAEITGRIMEVNVEEGLVVEAGQLLARLDSEIAEVDLDLTRARVLSAEATVAAIQADLRDAERILSRTQALNRQSFASEADFTKADASVASLTAQLARARADLEIARLQVRRQEEEVEDHYVRAPFAGVVVQKAAQPGEIVSPVSAGGGFTRTGICTLVDMDSLEIEVDVNEANIGRVTSGQAVEAVLDAYPDWRIPAYVIAIVPTANRDKATIKVRVGLSAKDGRVLPEMAAKVTFLERRADTAAN